MCTTNTTLTLLFVPFILFPPQAFAMIRSGFEKLVVDKDLRKAAAARSAAIAASQEQEHRVAAE